MNFKVFVEAAIQEPIIMLMTFAWLRHRNKNIFLCLNPDDRLLLTWISRFLWKQTLCWWFMRGWRGHFCLFECWLPLFIWQTFVDLNFYVFSKPTMSSISLQSCGCLLCINVFGIGIFLFVWMLIASIYFINCCRQEIQSFYGSNTIWP